MKKSDFDKFKITLNLNIEVDNSLRRISEKVRFLNQYRDTSTLSELSTMLYDIELKISDLISNACKDE